MEISTDTTSSRTIVSRTTADKIQLDLRELAPTRTDVVLLLSTLVLIDYFQNYVRGKYGLETTLLVIQDVYGLATPETHVAICKILWPTITDTTNHVTTTFHGLCPAS